MFVDLEEFVWKVFFIAIFKLFEIIVVIFTTDALKKMKFVQIE